MEGVGKGGEGRAWRLLLSKRCAGAPPPPHARAASTRRHHAYTRVEMRASRCGRGVHACTR